ncbi:hypothetical protein [Lutibacter sp.]|uniref:hypothetical protein n=1 Tax=Lutibacter sp. TaxID=1925666 RepID=UPI001A26C729|nr:hypothetical protein [Lutibacter sp.]MBI9041118.1 hypothetical protein [Lutibacter sp.]
MKIRLFILLLIGFYSSIFSQEVAKNIEQLKLDLLNETIDTSKVSILIKIADQFKFSEKSDSSFYYYNKAVKVAEISKSQFYLAKAYKKAAINYYYSGRYVEALGNF